MKFMDQIWIIILSLFAALGIAWVVIGIGEWLVFGSEQVIESVRLELQVKGDHAMLPFAVQQLAQKCQCGKAKVQIVIRDNGLTQEQIDTLLLGVSDVQIEKEQ